MSFQEKIDNLAHLLSTRNVGAILKTASVDFGVDLRKMETLENLNDSQARQFLQTLSPMLDFKQHNRSVFNTCALLGYKECVEFIIPRTNEEGIAEAQTFALAYNQTEIFDRLWKEKSDLNFNKQDVLKKLLDRGDVSRFFEGMSKVGVAPQSLKGYFFRAMLANKPDIYEPLYTAIKKLRVDDFNPLLAAARFSRLEPFKKYLPSDYTPSLEMLEDIKNKPQFLEEAYPYTSDAEKIFLLPYVVKNDWTDRANDIITTLLPKWNSKKYTAQEKELYKFKNVVHKTFVQALKSNNLSVAETMLGMLNNKKAVANEAYANAIGHQQAASAQMLLPYTSETGRIAYTWKFIKENNQTAAKSMLENISLNKMESALYQELGLKKKDVGGLLAHPSFNETAAAIFSVIQRDAIKKQVKAKPTEEKLRLI